MIRSLIGVYLASMAAVAGAQTVSILGADLIEAGIYEARTIRREEAPGTAAGITHIMEDPKFTEITSTIRAKVGTRFGYRFVVRGSPAGAVVPLRMVTVFPNPGMLNPKTGEFLPRDERSTDAQIGRPLVSGFSIDGEHEIVPGEWIFEIFSGQQKLLESRFTMVRE